MNTSIIKHSEGIIFKKNLGTKKVLGVRIPYGKVDEKETPLEDWSEINKNENAQFTRHFWKLGLKALA